MTPIDELIKQLIDSQGNPKAAAELYDTFLKATFIIPSKKLTDAEQAAATQSGEPFVPLYTEQNGSFFLLSFDTVERLDTWAGEQRSDIDFFKITGDNLVRALGDKVYLCLNFGTKYYKEFPPDEINRLKSILAQHGKVD